MGNTGWVIPARGGGGGGTREMMVWHCLNELMGLVSSSLIPVIW